MSPKAWYLLSCLAAADTGRRLNVMDDRTIRTAVAAWLSDARAAKATYGHISTWETGGVTDMSHLFCGRPKEHEEGCNIAAASFNENIGAWDTSGVTTMYSMFMFASVFDQPLGDWRVDKVINMNSMFWEASSFNRPLGSWTVDKAKDMGAMFFNALAFNQPLGDWRVDKVTSTNAMFAGASSFNRPLAGWWVDQVEDMSMMFWDASSFNQPLGEWWVDNVTRLDGMFHKASSFNQPLSSWRVDKVTSMYGMFEGASRFNQPLGGSWSVNQVTNMVYMFKGASKFDQDLGWCVDHDVFYLPKCSVLLPCGVKGGGYFGCNRVVTPGRDAPECRTEHVQDTIRDAFKGTACASTSCGVNDGDCDNTDVVTTSPSVSLFKVILGLLVSLFEVIFFLGASLPVREIKPCDPYQSPAHWLNPAQVCRDLLGRRLDLVPGFIISSRNRRPSPDLARL